MAELIREGLTYREIAGVLYLSKRTVETHAAHIFAKLGLSGRRELERQGRLPSASSRSATSRTLGSQDDPRR